LPVFPRRPVGREVDLVAVARGFVFGDGSKPKTASNSRANFCWPKDESLLPLFDGLGCPPRHYPREKLTVVNGLPGHWKTDRPSLSDSPNAIYGWLAGYFAADGDVGDTGRPTLTSFVRDNLEHVRLLCNQVGVGTYGIRCGPPGPYSPDAVRFLVGLMRGDLEEDFFLLPHHRANFTRGRLAIERRGWIVVSTEPTDRVEEVFSAGTEETRCFALEDNILVGSRP
jgi:hypothetical protein